MVANKEGQRVPQVVFHTRSGNDWKEVSTDDLFAGKTVVLFALPGAFTPTCSSQHLPRFNALAPTFFANGVDSILCLSVNDSFVMNEWAKDQEADNIVMVPDGNGAFTAQMGMLVDDKALGFGFRSWRYAMLVKDGVIEKMFIEPQEPGDPFKVSDADTMLAYLNPRAKKPDQVVVFSKDGCPHCIRAKTLLNALGIDFVDVPLHNRIRGTVLGAIAGKMTAPQIFMNGELIGGADALEQLLAAA